MKIKKWMALGIVSSLGMGGAASLSAQPAGQDQQQRPGQQQAGQQRPGQQLGQQPGQQQQRQLGGQQQAGLDHQQHGQMSQSHRASKLIGRDVKSSDGQEIGELKDVTFNQQGQIFALVELDDDRMAVLPWQKIDAKSAAGEDEDLKVNTTKESITRGPTITEEAFANLNNPQFTRQVYSHYQVQPPAAVGGIGGVERGAGQQRQEQQRPQLQQQPGQPGERD
jgi:hypothetical protein